VSQGVNALRSPIARSIVVTHYQRLLDYIVPDFVHVLSAGRIVRSGGQGTGARAGSQGLRLDRNRSRGRAEIVMPQVAERTDSLSWAFDAFRNDASLAPPVSGPRAKPRLAGSSRRVFPRPGSKSGSTRTSRRLRKRNSVARRRSTLRGRRLKPFLFASEVPHRVVLVNGRWSKELSSLDALPAGVTVRSMRDALATPSAQPRTAPDWLLTASAGMPLSISTRALSKTAWSSTSRRRPHRRAIHIVCSTTGLAPVSRRGFRFAPARSRRLHRRSYGSLPGAAFTNS
jgi:hypothetical protein